MTKGPVQSGFLDSARNDVCDARNDVTVRLGTRLALCILVFVVAIAAQLPSDAAGYLYSGKRKVVNCGVLDLASGATTGSFTQPLGAGCGDLFNLLDYLTSMKPAGWSLDNPYAPVDGNGNKFNKQNPDFWRVNLATARNLSRMHILYLPAAGNVKLADEDREKLRKFVDNGGVLWVDNSGGVASPLTFADSLAAASSAPGTFFIPNVYFGPSTSGGVNAAASRHHPLLTSPYWIDDSEIPMLGANWGDCMVNPGYSMDGTGGWGGVSEPPLFTDVLFPIVSKVGLSITPETSVAANAYGSGRVVATANFVGGGCFLPYPHNLPSLKFAYNVMAWASSWTDLRKDPRRSGRSIDTVGGTELIKMWSLKNAPPTGESGAVIYKGVAFYSSGNMLYALDVTPQKDIDQNGNPDDGLQGGPPAMISDGADIIWIWPSQDGGMLSSPEVVTAQDPTNPYKTVEAVLVLSSTGSVYMLDAFPNTNGILLPAPTLIVPPWPTASTPIPNPPIYINGWVYTAAGDGRLYAFNPALEMWLADHSGATGVASKWVMPSDFGASGGGTATLKAGPNFGFVSTGGSGAVVGMVYWCATAPPMAGGLTGMSVNDHVYGVPVYVRNDRLKFRAINDKRDMAEYQIAYYDANVSSAPKPVVRVETKGPAAQSINVYPNRGFMGGVPDLNTPKRGSILVEIPGGLPADAMVYGDYSLDYASTGGLTVVQYPRIRVPLQPDSNTNNDTYGYLKAEILSTPAMGPDSALYLSGVRRADSPMHGSGSVYGLQNDGTTQKTKWNYMLHSGVPPEALQGISTGAVPLPGLLVRKPEGASFVSMFRPQSFSSPVVAGDKVFVAISGDSGGPSGSGLSRGALLCFKANPDFVIRITENGGFGPDGRPIRVPKRLYDLATNRPLQVKVWQPNLLGESTGLGPTVESVMVSNDMIDRERGTITFNNFDRPKLRGGIGGISGLVEGNTFSPSLPVWVQLDNVEVAIDWSTWGPSAALAKLMDPPATIPSLATDSVDLSGWSNLLWYYVVPPYDDVQCSGISSSPVVVGDTVYFETNEGILYAITAETGESLGGPLDPWNPSDPTWKPDPKYVLWREKVSDQGGTLATGVNPSASGSNGVLLVPGPDGLYAYANPSTLVADNNRVVEVDGAGEVTWSVDAFFVPMSIPASNNDAPARRSVPVNKPARARYTGTGEILVTNSGTNQVCKIDKSGAVGVQKVIVKGATETDGWIKWVYERFTDPKRLLRPGQSTEISSPTDALFWTDMEPIGDNDQTVVTHCLIADSGNSRVLDLVYRFNGGKLIASPTTMPDPASSYVLPELNWVSNTESKAEKYVFDCLQVVPNSDATEGGHNIWAAISNFKVDPTTPNPQGLGGAIVSLNYRRPINHTSGPPGWNYAQETLMGIGPGEIIAGCDRVTVGGAVQPLANPRYFQAVLKPNGMFLLICDNHGVYSAGPVGGAAPPVVAMISDKDYREMIDRDDSQDEAQFTGVPLVATNVQELPNGRWLITNSYSGSNLAGTQAFNGEVFEYSFDSNNPMGLGKIAWSAPKLEFSGPDWMQKMDRSYILQQPRSAFRQF